MSILNILIIASCLLSCICFRICSCLFTFWLGLKAYFEPIFGAHSLDPMQGPIKAFFCVILESICRAHFSLCPARTQQAINRPLGPAETRPCTIYFPWHKAPFHACRPRRACPFNIVFYLHVHGSSPWRPNLQRSIMSPMQPLQAPDFFCFYATPYTSSNTGFHIDTQQQTTH